MAQNKQSKTTKATDKKVAKKKPAKKAATSKTTAKKAAPAKKAAAKKSAAPKKAASKTTAKKAVSKAPAKKSVAKKATGVAPKSQTSTTTSTIDSDVIWSVFQNDSADISATVNGKVIYANDVVPSSLKKRVLAWFKR